MSGQEVRNEIIRENVPKLIKELTGFEDDGDIVRHCEQFAWSIIRNHRNLSTNSHEVRRKIEGIKEKFTVDNCAEYAKHLERLCDEVIQHPLCVNHYEVDVQWSMLDFLLTLAYNPTGALKHNKHKIDLSLHDRANCKDELQEPTEADYWANILKEDFIPIVKLDIASDSELSDWSDDANTEQNETESIPKEKARELSIASTCSRFANIKPPSKEQPFKLFNADQSKERLHNVVQHSWWLPNDTKNILVDSERMEANFALLYSRFLSETSNNLIRYDAPDTATEQCLLRELLWMFHAPQMCKFFYIDAQGVKVRDNVTIPSLTVNGLAKYLEQHFLPPIHMMDVLRKFLESIYVCEDFTPPKTLECYAANLRLLLEPIWQKFLDFESRLLVQQDFEINTIISFHDTLRGTLRQLECIYEVHRQVVLNLHQYPAHISSAFLLTSLMHYNQVASNTTESNLAMSLFLTSVKVFCVIIDTWWTEGRLDDWQQEFLVERASSSDQSICVRQFCKNKEKAFFVPSNVSKVITENSFFRLLLEHSLEAGCTLNLLYEINRIGDLKNICGVIESKLYNVFIEDVMSYVRTLQSQLKVNDSTTLLEVPGGAEIAKALDDRDVFANETVDSAGSIQTLSNIYQEIRGNLTTSDEFLLFAFTSNIELTTDECDAVAMTTAAAAAAGSALPVDQDLDALRLFEQFGKTKHILPLEEVILSSLTRILKTRIAFANSFVMQLYREEFVILKHLRNIRKVLLLEASDLMHQFYDKLFKQIESGKSWANPFLLSMQLDDIICAKFPEMSALFRLEINSAFRCQTNKVFEAVDELIATYNFSRELSHIITQHDIEEYNKVFRFLLKVKWGITTLENLRFPRSHKRRIPYAPFEMIDLLMRRLEQLRFWMIYAIQSIHFHLMTHVLQSMGEQLDEKIANCTNLKEMETVHRSYVSTVCEHCFLVDSFSAIKLGVEQLLNLTFILRLEWNSCVKYIENNSPLAIDVTDSNNEDTDTDYVADSQIDAIELTYIRCHQYLANKLNNEVYLKQRTFLSGLSAAFNTSLPY